MFSVGKDRLVKYWDADKFELLLTLEGHHAEVWCLAVSNRGDFIVTGSHDRSIRRWDRTEEPFFIEVFYCKKTKETLSATDLVIDALDMADAEIKRIDQHKVEVVCRVTTVLLQTHHNQLTTAVAARPVLIVLKDILHERVKELMSMRSDAPFRDAKAKLMEIRQWQSKRAARGGDTNENRRKKKKQKPASETGDGA
ncbi:hypothetical protein B296_00013074 [Ensete ventricosum]|uniref:Uncharacterized protein n=1 Tax=Ensete ventricosum TaxID=4639 RepID=A0A427A0M2_ENSVE|nr:hypothetical protein B296_00013074 [Ensete ventricosum]